MNQLLKTTEGTKGTPQGLRGFCYYSKDQEAGFQAKEMITDHPRRTPASKMAAALFVFCLCVFLNVNLAVLHTDSSSLGQAGAWGRRWSL